MTCFAAARLASHQLRQRLQQTGCQNHRGIFNRYNIVTEADLPLATVRLQMGLGVICDPNRLARSFQLVNSGIEFDDGPARPPPSSKLKAMRWRANSTRAAASPRRRKRLRLCRSRNSAKQGSDDYPETLIFVTFTPGDVSRARYELSNLRRHEWATIATSF
jgi:hypothetical protein